MANLTITVNPETLKRARIKAIEQGTSVNRVLGEYLEEFAEDAAREGDTAGDVAISVDEDEDEERRERVKAFEELWALADKHPSGSGPEGRTWTREDLYDRPVLQWDRRGQSDRSDG